MRPGSHVEAPTHLGSNQLGLPPEWLGDDDAAEIVTSAVRGGRGVPSSKSYASGLRGEHAPSYHSFSAPPLAAYPAPRVHTERSDSAKQLAPAPRVRTESSSDALPAAPAPVAPAPRKSRKSSEARDAARSRKSRSSSRDNSRSAAPVQAEQPGARPSQPADAPVAPVAPGINAIDPLSVPVPPELGPTIYGWVRRLALQADLAGADRLLREALLDLSSSLSVTIVYPGQDGLWSLGNDDEIPREAQPIIAVAQARRAVVSSHSAIIPVLTTSETVAVVTLTRNPRNPAYHPVEQIAMIALVRESAAILHHLAVAHLQKQSEINADKGGLYRGEALEAHRSRGNEGVPVHLTPAWVKRTYPILGITILIAILFAAFVRVPTYSTGFGAVQFEGTPVTSPVIGTVEQLLVEPGQQVKKGQVVVRLHSADQDAELAQATTEFQDAETLYLLDRNDDAARKGLLAASTRLDRAKAQAETRVIRARKDGTVSDTRVKIGSNLNPGDHILTINDPGTEPEVIAFLPGGDRPRLRVGMDLQIDLAPSGYRKVREHATITYVGTEAIGGSEAAKYVGAELADSMQGLKTGGPFVIVKARLPKPTYTTDKQTYRYHSGMPLVTEVKVQSKPFIVTLLPALEKYYPE